ncbi:sulfotransferase [Microtetraspora glauca]|uniref:Sulfotransferase n=1 Tax=Microtetraspora glauca TaxID=1996 RepID=A0ABV3GBC1_MICGL
MSGGHTSRSGHRNRDGSHNTSGYGGPLLVTGLPRSGTSWAGKMLAASGRLVYVNEPLNPEHPPGRSPGVLDASVTHRFQYICPDDESPWLEAFTRTIGLRYGHLAELRRNRRPRDLARMAKYGTAFRLGRLIGRRALLDDPFALFSAAWFARRLGCRVLVLVRDPVSFVGSWQRLGWTVYFHELLEQPLLVRDHPCVEELRPLVGSQDRIAKAAALWRVARRVTADLAAADPGIRIVGYESLATAPLDRFRDLYAWCGLPWSERAAGRIAAACTAATGTPATGFSWTGLSRTAFRPMDSRAALGTYRERLTPGEVSRIRDLTSALQ